MTGKNHETAKPPRGNCNNARLIIQQQRRRIEHLEAEIRRLREEQEQTAYSVLPPHPCFEEPDCVVSCDGYTGEECLHKSRGGTWENCSSGKLSVYHHEETPDAP